MSSSTTLLDYTRGVAQMGIVVNGRTVNVFSTHMEWDVAWWRPIQITEAVNWVANFSEPRIVLGDFNTWPGTSDYDIIASPLLDAWAAALDAFASLLGVSLRTVQDWEQGRRKPSGPAEALLRIAEQHPEVFTDLG